MRRSTALDAGGRRFLISNDFGDYAVLDRETHGASRARFIRTIRAMRTLNAAPFSRTRPDHSS